VQQHMLPMMAQLQQQQQQQQRGLPVTPQGVQFVEWRGRPYCFNGPLVCGVCGIRGHAADTCSVSYCQGCDRFGHATYRCVERKTVGGVLWV
jgi:hypothetical protein